MTVAAPTKRPATRPRRVAQVFTAPAAERPGAPRARMARRGRGAVLFGLAAAFGVQLAIGQAVQRDREAFADPLYYDKWERLRGHPAGAPAGAGAGRPFTLLFLGSSRTYDAIDAGGVGTALSRDLGRPVAAFNFAHSGAGPVTLAVYLRRLLREGVAPDAVVIEVHPAFLADQVSPPFETRWLKPLRLRPDEIELVRALGLPVDVPAAHGPRGRLLAGHEYRVHLLERYAPAFSPLQYRLVLGPETDAHGFVRVPDLAEHQKEKLRTWTRNQYAPCWPNYSPGGSGMTGLRDVLETCRASGIRATLLITPESAEFRGWYAEPGRSRVAPVVNALACEFQAPFVDAREWLTDDLFADGHHLIGAGADVFTERLVREALAPWLRAGGAP